MARIETNPAESTATPRTRKKVSLASAITYLPISAAILWGDQPGGWRADHGAFPRLDQERASDAGGEARYGEQCPEENDAEPDRRASPPGADQLPLVQPQVA